MFLSLWATHVRRPRQWQFPPGFAGHYAPRPVFQRLASSRRVLRLSGSGMVKKRFRLSRKTPAHPSLVMGFNVVHGCGRGCVLWSFRCFMLLILRGGVVDQGQLPG